MKKIRTCYVAFLDVATTTTKYHSFYTNDRVKSSLMHKMPNVMARRLKTIKSQIDMPKQAGAYISYIHRRDIHYAKFIRNKIIKI